LIAIRRASRKAGGRRRRLKRPPRIPWPAGAERSYRKSLLNIVSKVRSTIEARLSAGLPPLLEKAKALRPTADNANSRHDDGDEIARLLSLIRSRILGEFSEAEIALMVSKIAQAISEKNKAGIGAVFKSVLGVDLFAAEPWLNDSVRTFVQSNVALIRTIPEKLLGQVENIVYDGARTGTSWQEIAGDLRDGPFQATKSRAELIARDQIGKFNGQLTELRQSQAGVTSYIWRTSLDERVREEHAAREGKEFAWNDPPDDGHPGEAINCRCYAEPVLDDLLDEEAS
jgi:SPP1 gp7 family putative phage head morphogenesis protein